MTTPLIGWVSKNSPSGHPYACGFKISKYGSQQDADWNWDPDCGNGNYTSGTPITGNDPLDTSIAITASYATGWVNHLVATFGTAANGGVQFYNLDNEPGLWNSTHRDIHPNPTTYDEMRNQTWAYAAAIKTADPTALTLGPVEDGWCRYFFSAADDCNPNGADRAAHGNVDYVAWYLQQMQLYEQQHGVRILDYFDLHVYPQAGGIYSDSVGSTTVQALRLRSTRQLWDPTYVDESWIGGTGWEGGTVKLIPRMKDWVANNYPGTKLAITEYNWGAQGYMNGALAQADLLGIFGREGLDLATLWGPPEDANAPAIFAFRMYRNYDGQGSAFGETSLQAASGDQEKLAVYAAQRNQDQALTFMIINKTGQGLTSALTLTNFQPGTTAKVYRYSAANLTAIVHEPDQSITAGGFSATFPANSITLMVIPPLTTYTISGNTGLANTNLNYTDGTPKTVTADGNGNYTITVPSGWTGTVTPWTSGSGFTPANRTYANVLADQSGQDYTASACSTTNVTIAGSLSGSYCLTSGQSTRQSYAANNGPVNVNSTGVTPILAAQRILYYGTGTLPTSFVEMMGLPEGQLDTTYWFPWYKNDGIVDTQLRIGNVSGSTATVHVYVAGVEVTGSPFTLTTSGAGQSQRLSFALNDGPVKVVSDQNIVATERLIYFNSGVPASFSEMMGLPNSQLSNTYWFPWYKNIGEVDTQLRIGNVSGATATVHIYIAGVEVTGSPFTLTASGAGQSQRLSFPVNDGPVKIVSDQNIVAAQRLIYSESGLPTSFVETMGIPGGQLNTTQWFPWYKNDGIVDTQLRIGNVSGAAASVHVYIGTTEMAGSPFALTATGAGQSLRLSFTANDGPVKIVSDQNIVTSERLIYFLSGVPVSFSEMMGTSDSLLSPTWWLPWYKNIGEIDTQLRFGMP